MDLLCDSDNKFGDMDAEMSDFLDNDVFHTTPTLNSGNYIDDDEWFNSFFEDPVLNDKMITDAAQPPRINSEHSYSSVNDSLGSSELSDIGKLEDLDSDILINNNALDLTIKNTTNSLIAKTEPVELDSIQITSTASPTVLTRTFTVTKQQPTIIVASSQGQATFSERSVLPKITVKTEPPDVYNGLDQTVNIDSLVLPPTPPSSSNSDSDSCPSPQRSAPSSPIRNHPYSRASSSLSSSSSSCSLSPQGSSRHYTHSLYSSSQSDSMDIVFQQIPTSGVLVLTEEEKRTLISEGYPIPSKLPLTKQEEKNLKKIRRKIKNKISAQESRRKKKEYLEALEKRVESFSQENNDLRKKVDTLENNNRSLLSQLQKLQSLVGKIRPSGTVPQTGLMVLVLCFAVFLGSWTPTSLNIGYGTSNGNPGLPAMTNPQLVKPSPMMGPQIEGAKVDAYCTPPMKSRVLMSLRGEQDDLTWYDIYGPNIPNAELEKQEGQVKKVISSTIKPEINLTSQKEMEIIKTEVAVPVLKAETPSVKKVEVVKVTVESHFGHLNHSRDEPLKTVIGKDITRGDLKAEGLVESADKI